MSKVARDPYGRDCLGERAVCRVLGGLALQGYRHVDDRRWPGSAAANVDHVLVGRTGVFLVDAKNWSGQVQVVDGRLTQQGRRREQRMLGLQRLAVHVDGLLATTYTPLLRAVPLVCFTNAAPHDQPALGRVLLCDLETLPDVILRRPVVLGPEQVALVWGLLTDAVAPIDVPTGDETEYVESALFALDEAEVTGLRAALARPVEDWMVWLHPEQAPLIRRQWSGPARIRGAAGTGKTTVGLHRLAWLTATRPGPTLWVSYVKTLSPVMAQAYRRLSPETADRVTFTHLHGLALGILKQRGVAYRMASDRERGEAWRDAWDLAGRGLSLAETGLSQEYLREEIDAVVKGRGISTVEEYLSVSRTGRRTAFSPSRRQRVWQLAVAYGEQLHARGLVDFTDLLTLALAEVRAPAATGLHRDRRRRGAGPARGGRATAARARRRRPGRAVAAGRRPAADLPRRVVAGRRRNPRHRQVRPAAPQPPQHRGGPGPGGVPSAGRHVRRPRRPAHDG